MKKYFTHNGMEQSGPFSIEELKAQNITESTPVWFEGLDDWTTIGNVDELQGLIVNEGDKDNRSSNPPILVEKKQSLSNPNIYNEDIQLKNHQNKNLKIFSLIGVLFSILGIIVSVDNWLEYTFQYEDSITLLTILCFFFLFFLVFSIYSIIKFRK